MYSINKVLNDENFDLTELTVKNVNELMGSDRALDPNVMNIMVGLLLSPRNSIATDSP
jgi:hypothetical protein